MRLTRTRSVLSMFTMVAVILVIQLLILTILFQYIAPPSTNNPENLVAVQISPGAIGLIEKDKLQRRNKRSLPPSHDINAVEYGKHVGRTVNGPTQAPSAQVDSGNDLKQYNRGDSDHNQRIRERLQDRVDADDIVQRKRSKERVDVQDKAPRQLNAHHSPVQYIDGENKHIPEHGGKKENDDRGSDRIKKDHLTAVDVEGLKRATVRDHATYKPAGGLQNEEPGQENESVEFQGGDVRHSVINKGNIARPQNENPVLELVNSDLKVKEPRRIPRLPSKRPDLDVAEDNHELTKGWEQNQLKLIHSKNKMDAGFKRTLKAIDAYKNSLEIPGLNRGGSIDEYVKRIQKSGKNGNLTYYLKDFCDNASEDLVECTKMNLRKLTPEEEEGRNVMFTLRTTQSYHDTRLNVLFETWLTTLYPGSVFLVTDGEDSDLVEQLENIGIHYINAQSGTSHDRVDLCCKAGVELELMFQPENKHFDWLCHVDDDMYLHALPLAKQFSKFDPRTEPVYFGRSGSEWDKPRVVRNTSLLGKPGQRYHFAVGGMYCLSRAMLELAEPYLVGCEAFSDSCNKTEEPEDVTVGLVVGAVLKKKLTRTQMIYSHGLDLLTGVPTPYIRDQIAFSHGFGSVQSWHSAVPNVVFIPGALFSIDDDMTQFKSIHCHIYPTLHWCVKQKKFLVEEKRKAKKEGNKKHCVCSWETYLCCEIIRSGYLLKLSKGSQEIAKQKLKEKESMNKTSPSFGPR